MGVGIFGKPIKGSVERMVSIIKKHSFSSEESLRKYFLNLDYGYALPLLKIKRFRQSVGRIKEKVDNFASAPIVL